MKAKLLEIERFIRERHGAGRMTRVQMADKLDFISTELEALNNNAITAKLIPQLREISDGLKVEVTDDSDGARAGLTRQFLENVKPFADEIVKHPLGKLAIAMMVTVALGFSGGTAAGAGVFLVSIGTMSGKDYIEKALEQLGKMTGG